MRYLFLAGAIGAVIWLVSRPDWQHASHGKQAGSAVAIAVPFVVLATVAAVAASRRSARSKNAAPRSPYSAGR